MKKKMIRLMSVFCALSILIVAIPVTAHAETSANIATGDAADSVTVPAAEQPTTPTIVDEKTEMREENVKYFRCDDGTILAAVYDRPVHYKNGDTWEDIDNSLTATTVKNITYYTNKANNFKVRMPDALQSGAPVQVENDGYTLQWVMTDQQNSGITLPVTPPPAVVASVNDAVASAQMDTDLSVTNPSETHLTNQRSAVTYADVYADTDLRYDVIGNTLKESIILDALPTRTSFSFHMQADGLTAVLQEDNTVQFMAADADTPVFVIDPPYMVDSNNAYSDDITVSLTATTDGWVYTLTPSREWLSDGDRAYPVTLDPTVSSGQATGESIAAEAYKYTPTTNRGSVATMRVGGISVSGSVYESQSFVKVTMPGSADYSDLQVVSAQLTLTYYAAGNTTANNTQINMYQVTELWDETTLTWNNRPTTATLISDYCIGTTGSGTCVFDVTALVNGWMKGTTPNYGVAFKSATPGSANAVAWQTDDSTTSTARPTVTVSLRECTGIEDYWTYTSMAVGRGAVASVNNATGALTIVIPDCGIDGNRMPVSISHVYNSATPKEITYGGKFRLNYQMTVTASGIADYPYYFTDSDGTKHYFKLEDGKLQDEDGLGLTLTVNDAATTERYTITAKDKSTMVFNNWGDLRFIRDTNNNQIQINYANTRISEIIDGSGRVYQLAYNENGRLESITDPAGRAITYSYNAWDELNTIRYPDGNVVNTFYDIVKVKRLRGNGQTIIFEYDTSKPIRVTGMSYYETTETTYIDRYTFNYKVNATDITDIAGNKFTYQFNSYLQTVCTVSHTDGSAQSYTMGKPGGTTGEENKVLMASDTQKSVVNHIINGSLDTDFTTDDSFIASSGTSYDSVEGHISPGSIKVTGSGDSTTVPYAFARQVYTIPADGYYTVSAYVKGSGTNPTGDFAGVLAVQRYENDIAEGDLLQTCTYSPSVNDWVRLSNSIKCFTGEQLYIDLGIIDSGTAWFDDIQLEAQTETANTYNLLENTDFSNNTTSWLMNVSGWQRAGITQFADSDYAIKINGSATQQVFGQEFMISNGKKGDTFSIGGWGKANSRHIDISDTSATAPAFSVRLDFISGDENVGARRVSFNPYYTDWQFTSGEAVAPADYDTVIFSFEYSNNVNTAWFALPYVYRDNYGQSYTYKDGNLVSATDQSQAETTYAYNDDQLSKLANPTGSTQLATYDKTTQNLKYLQTSDGQRYEYTYDSYGNATGATVYAAPYATELVAGTPYYIRNAFSGNAFTAESVAHDKVCNNQRWSPAAATQLYTLIATGTPDLYAIRPSDAAGENLRVDVEGGTANNGARLQLYSDNGLINQRFKIIQNDNGTFTIQTQMSNYAKCIDGQPGNLTDTDDDTPVTQQPIVEGDSGQQWYFIPYNANDTATEHLETAATYTADGNYLATSTDALGNVTSYETDSRGNTTSATAANGVKTTYGYDTHGIHNTTVTVSKDGTNAGSVSYTYSQDRLTTITAPGGTLYTLTYDAYGRSDATYIGTAATGRQLSKSTYNANGLLSKLDYGNGISVNYAYDALGRQTEMWYSDYPYSGLKTFYNARGQIGLIKDFSANTRTRYTYDLAGRLSRAQKTLTAYSDIFGNAADITYLYEDGTNRLTNTNIYTRWHAVQMKYTYGRATKGEMPDVIYGVGRGNLVEVSYTYDALGRLANRDLPLAYWDMTYTYADSAADPNHTSTQITSVTTASRAGTTTTQYTYDAVGNIVSQTENGVLTEYLYDTLGQLKVVNYGGNPDFINDDTYYGYTYDANGNILTARHETYADGVVYDNTYTYGNSTWKDLLTAYNGQTITYDTIGNPLTYRDGISLTWKNGRKLASYTKNGTTVNFSYGADGTRIGKTGTEFLSVDGVLYAQKTGNTILAFMYDEKGIPYMVTQLSVDDLTGDFAQVTAAGTHYYYEYNLQGDVIGLFDENGDRVAAYTYDPWGKPLTVTDGSGNTVTSSTHIANLNPLRYRGYYYDTETGFYLTGTRYYDPEIGRFINADGQLNPQEGMTGYNLFQYCGNNPVNRIDPTGEAWWHWALGAAVVAACAVATVVTCGGFAAAAGAVAAVGSGVAAATTASTIAAGAFIGSATVYGMAVVSAASTSSSVKEFNDKGNWGTVAATAGGAIVGGAGAYLNTKGSNSAPSTTKPKVTSTIKNDVIDLPRTGSALKTDPYHAFPNIVDNYAGYATKSPINNGTLYQLQGSLNGTVGRFEWIIQNQQVTHRMFVPGGGINGIPIMP